jgi:hypothetical protein
MRLWALGFVGLWFRLAFVVASFLSVFLGVSLCVPPALCVRLSAFCVVLFPCVAIARQHVVCAVYSVHLVCGCVVPS